MKSFTFDDFFQPKAFIGYKKEQVFKKFLLFEVL